MAKGEGEDGGKRLKPRWRRVGGVGGEGRGGTERAQSKPRLQSGFPISPPTSARSNPSRPSIDDDAAKLKQKKHISLKEIRVLCSMKRFHNGFVLGSHTHTRQYISCPVEDSREGEVDGCVG